MESGLQETVPSVRELDLALTVKLLPQTPHIQNFTVVMLFVRDHPIVALLRI